MLHQNPNFSPRYKIGNIRSHFHTDAPELILENLMALQAEI